MRPANCRHGETIYGYGPMGRTAQAHCNCAGRCAERNRLISRRNAAYLNRDWPAYAEREARLQLYTAKHYDSQN